jgi:hypothetical protein|tara:strand:- start:403 stop:816 length:414 start_codon:yes stop_codon:yes gene_type:complete
MINKFKQFFETQTSLLMKKAGTFKEDNLECLIDEDVVDCAEFDEDPVYVGVPAPVVLPTDEWFNSPVLTEKGIDYMEQETAIKMQDDFSVESDDIHQRMYEIATENWSTVEETQGGSENFQEGPGGWLSSNGWSIFR